MARYLITPPARVNLNSIRAYLNRQSDSGWLRLSRKLRTACVMLAENPHVGFREPKWTSRGYRFFAVGRYIIAYEPDSRPLKNISVVHSALDIGRVLRPR